MKVLTIMGTRPEIIRLSRIISVLDAACEHILVFSGQNYSPELSSRFFEEMEIRAPQYNFAVKASSTWEQISNILCKTESLLLKHRPDRFLVLGDTNTALAALVAKRLGIPVFHMEAGNRCYDERVPEEVNRRVIDHASDMLLPYTLGSRENLLREGILPSKVLVTGNPIKEVLDFYGQYIASSCILEQLGLAPGQYFLATLHRAENVDIPKRLIAFMSTFELIGNQYGLPVLISLHPHTQAALKAADYTGGKHIHFLSPPGFFDFVHLEQHAKAILSDSGTVQEEACLLGIPAITLRDTTERPETLECGSNILTGGKPETILSSLALALKRRRGWNVPPEYLEANVSLTVAGIVLGNF